MTRIVGQQAHTPERQAFAREVVTAFVTQSPALKVAAEAGVVQYQPGQLSPMPALKQWAGQRHPGANPGGHPITGKRVGRSGELTP